MGNANVVVWLCSAVVCSGNCGPYKQACAGLNRWVVVRWVGC